MLFHGTDLVRYLCIDCLLPELMLMILIYASHAIKLPELQIISLLLLYADI